MSLNLLASRAKQNHTSKGPNWQDFVLSLSPWSFLRFKEASTATAPADSSGNARPGAWVGSPTLAGPSVVPGDVNGKSFLTATGPKAALLSLPPGAANYTWVMCRQGALAGWGVTQCLTRFPSNGNYMHFSGGLLNFNGAALTYVPQPLLTDGKPHIYIIRVSASSVKVDTDKGGTARAGVTALPNPAQAGIGFNYFPGGNEGSAGQYGEAISFDRILTDDEVAAMILTWKGENSNSTAIKARFWRLYITAYQTGGDGYISLNNISLRSSPGGFNQANISSGTATESSFFSATTKSLQTYKDGGGNWSTATGQVSPWWTAFDFGAGRSVGVAEIGIVGVVTGRQPKDFQIQTSPDGLAWTTVATYTGVTGWVNGVEKTFAIPH